MSSLNKIPKKNKNLAWRIINNEAVVMPLENQAKEEEKLNIFNETATRIWELIDGNNSVAGIIKKITNEYDIGFKETEFHVKSFLDSLFKKGLIDF
ncbi:MAG: PqqD family protein [Candidatus Omnitrophica bacterium]|nr:PqqD family protein [Candidatus Omnitrophota bacterium]